METQRVLCMTGSCNVITLNINRIIQDIAQKIGGKFQTIDRKKKLKWYGNAKYHFKLGYKSLLYLETSEGVILLL